jgi:chromosome segregation ATPase
MIYSSHIEEKIRRHEAQLQQWRGRHQELLNALRECEQQIIAHSAVIEALREIHSETTPKPQDCATMEPDEP